MFQTHHVYFMPQNWKQPFIQETLVSFSGKLYFKTILVVTVIFTVTGLATVFIPFLLKELEEVCMFMIVHQFISVFLIPFQDYRVLT